MAKMYKIFLSVLIVHSVSAAPSEVEKIENIANVEKAEPKLDGKTLSLLDEVEGEGDESQRQKRWYNFGFNPINPTLFQSFGKRDQGFNTGYEYEDPYAEIHRRLLDISNVVRQPAPPPPPLPPQFPAFSTSQFPFYLPVIYVPQIGCSCPPQAENPPVSNTGRDNKPDNEKNITMPDGIPNRFPDLEDPRQNFGLVINETDPDDEGDDVGRPISFDPIQPDRPMSRPPPPVEHGTSQGSANGDSNQSAVPESQTPTTSRPPSQGNPTTVNPFPQSTTSNSFPEAPSACDGAVLNCCHQFEVTYDCFAVQGCPDPTSYGNPCDSNVILRVIERYQRFYSQRTG